MNKRKNGIYRFYKKIYRGNNVFEKLQKKCNSLVQEGKKVKDNKLQEEEKGEKCE